LLDGVLPCEAHAVADHCRMEEHLVRGRALTALVAELHVELDRSRTVGAMGLDDELDPRRRVQLDDELVRLDLTVERGKPQARRMLEHDAKLGLRGRQALARA